MIKHIECASNWPAGSAKGSSLKQQTPGCTELREFAACRSMHEHACVCQLIKWASFPVLTEKQNNSPVLESWTISLGFTWDLHLHRKVSLVSFLVENRDHLASSCSLHMVWNQTIPSMDSFYKSCTMSGFVEFTNSAKQIIEQRSKSNMTSTDIRFRNRSIYLHLAEPSTPDNQRLQNILGLQKVKNFWSIPSVLLFLDANSTLNV